MSSSGRASRSAHALRLAADDLSMPRLYSASALWRSSLVAPLCSSFHFDQSKSEVSSAAKLQSFFPEPLHTGHLRWPARILPEPLQARQFSSPMSENSASAGAEATMTGAGAMTAASWLTASVRTLSLSVV